MLHQCTRALSDPFPWPSHGPAGGGAAPSTAAEDYGPQWAQTHEDLLVPPAGPREPRGNWGASGGGAFRWLDKHRALFSWVWKDMICSPRTSPFSTNTKMKQEEEKKQKKGKRRKWSSKKVLPQTVDPLRCFKHFRTSHFPIPFNGLKEPVNKSNGLQNSPEIHALGT